MERILIKFSSLFMLFLSKKKLSLFSTKEIYLGHYSYHCLSFILSIELLIILIIIISKILYTIAFIQTNKSI